jgi:hypothetical protein
MGKGAKSPVRAGNTKINRSGKKGGGVKIPATRGSKGSKGSGYSG